MTSTLLNIRIAILIGFALSYLLAYFLIKNRSSFASKSSPPNRNAARQLPFAGTLILATCWIPFVLVYGLEALLAYQNFLLVAVLLAGLSMLEQKQQILKTYFHRSDLWFPVLLAAVFFSGNEALFYSKHSSFLSMEGNWYVYVGFVFTLAYNQLHHFIDQKSNKLNQIAFVTLLLFGFYFLIIDAFYDASLAFLLAVSFLALIQHNQESIKLAFDQYGRCLLSIIMAYFSLNLFSLQAHPQSPYVFIIVPFLPVLAGLTIAISRLYFPVLLKSA